MDQLVNAAQEMAKLSNELQDEIAKFNIGESVTSKEKGYTQANVGHKPVPERKIVEQKTPINKPEGSSQVSNLQTLTK